MVAGNRPQARLMGKAFQAPPDLVAEQVQRRGPPSFVGRVLVIILVVAVAAALWLMINVLVLLFGAILLALGLDAGARGIVHRTGLPRPLAIAAIGLAVLAAFGAALWLFGSIVGVQLDQVWQVAPAGWTLLMDRLGANPYGRQLLEQARSVNFTGATGWATSAIAVVAGALTRGVGYGGIMVLVAIYLAAQPARYRLLCVRLVPTAQRRIAERLLDSAGSVLRRWLVGQMVVMGAIGVLSGIGLWALGIEAAFALGLMGGLLCFIPFVGAILAAVPATLVALSQGPVFAGSVVLMYVAVHLVEGNLITPLVQSEATALPPVLAILSMVACSLLLGPLGVLFAAPLTLLLLVSVEILYVQEGLGEPPETDTEAETATGAVAVATDKAAINAGPKAIVAIREVWTQRMERTLRPVLVGIPLLGLFGGFATQLSGHVPIAGWIWGGATLPVLLALLVQIAVSLWRGEFGLDIVAALSMAGALVFGEQLAAVVVALMYAGGQYLENFADGRARREMTKLLSRVPRTALRRQGDALEEVNLDMLEPGDRIMVRRGEIVAVDGAVASDVAVLDQSALTGESLPIQQRTGEAVLSGSTNAGDAFDLLVSARAEASTYAGIVRLVGAAQQSKAPMSRLADRFAMAFLGVTIAMAGGAWIWTGDPIRALAVLVIATPCPLILAVPVAIISGVSRAAKLGVLIKGGRALENLARVKTLVIDKTGTLTHGAARLVAIEVAAGFTDDEVLGLAASLDQASSHVIAQALVSAAHAKGLVLTAPDAASETAGEGVEGAVSGRKVVVGGTGFVAKRCSGALADSADRGQPTPPGAVLVAVGIDGRTAGRLVLSDEVRAGTKDLLDGLRASGIQRIVLASGDRAAVADAVVAGLPIDQVRADLTPDQKIAVIQEERQKAPVLMVGDGVNDAPALAAADVGIAMGARGAAASAEVADVVLLVDRLDRVLSALRIAVRSRDIALQSVYAGVGLSFAGMVVAALGYLTPVRGALVQEVIDVAVILNALRALAAPAGESAS